MCFLYQESGKMKATLFLCKNFHIASLDYNNIKNWNPDVDFPRFIIKTDYYCPKMQYIYWINKKKLFFILKHNYTTK